MDLPNIVCERVHMSVPLLFSFMIHIGWPCSMAFEHHYQNKVLDLFVVLQMPMFSLILRTKALHSLTSSCHSNPLFALIGDSLNLLNTLNSNCEFVAHTFTCGVFVAISF